MTIKAEQIPDAVVAPLVNLVLDRYGIDIAWVDARAAILAALNAWPGMETVGNADRSKGVLILPLDPLTQEPTDVRTEE